MSICDTRIGYISPLDINPEQALDCIDMRSHKVGVGCRKVRREKDEAGLWIRVWDRDTDDTTVFVLSIANAKKVVQMLNRELQRHECSSLILLDVGQERGQGGRR